MSNPIDVKAIARNSMLEKLQSKIKKQNIQVQAFDSFEDDEEEQPFTPMIPETKSCEMSNSAKVYSSFLHSQPFFAVVEIDGDLLGGTLPTVMAEVEKSDSDNVEFKVVTTDEKAAKAFFKAPKNETTAAPQVDEVGSFYVITDTVTADSELHDICFKADVLRMMLQAKGGLEQNQVLGIYKEKATAVAKARELLKAAGSPHADQDDSVVDQ